MRRRTSVRMNNETSRNLVWRKAAVLGSIWAASEIVLGSFLHNARVPFKGELLSAIGIVILVAGHKLWPERGLMWRTGFICAAMKSVSPSAAIFGPMIAIAMEGLLAEAGVRLLGGNAAGYILAGGLAMCWAIAHKLVNLLIFYGPDTVAVYLRGAEWLQARFSFSTGSLRAPLFLLFGTYFLAGAAAAIAGMRAGGGKSPSTPSAALKPGQKTRTTFENPARTYSVAALILHIVFVTVVMAAARKIPSLALAAGAGAYGCLCAWFYPPARSLLRQTGIWAGVLLASVSAGLILGSVEAGIYMALRAFLLTLAFSAIGCELLNPAIRRFMKGLGGGDFFETLEYAFSALPGIIAGLPAGRDFARRPLAGIGGVVAHAPFLLDAVAQHPVFMITGAHGGGKSKLVLELAKLVRGAGKTPGGICAAGLWENGVRSGFDLIDLRSAARIPLCRREHGGAVRVGEFRFFDEGVASGRYALSAAGLSGADVAFVDEVGFWELDGGGWAPELKELLSGKTPLVLVVRESLLERVAAYFRLDRPIIWGVGDITAGKVLPELLAVINAAEKTGA